MTNEVPPTRFGDLVDTMTITRGIPTQATASSGQLPVFSVPDLRSGSPAKRFVDPTALNTALDAATEGDVLIALEGAAAGEVFVVPEDFPRFVPSQQVAVIRIWNRSRLNPWYLGSFLSTEAAHAQLRRLTRGQKVQRIPLQDLDTLTIPLAPPSAQTSVADQYRACQRAIRAHRETAQHLEKMCDALSELNFDD